MVAPVGFRTGEATLLGKGALRYPMAEEGWFWGRIRGLIGQRALR